jgi:4-amino-4-deoxy-L-arabinose transferase-like glycosyltransferase
VALARLGNIPFFLLLLIATWLLGNLLGGRGTAFFSVLLLVSVPAILGNAGLATTDLSLTAFLTLFLFFLLKWLRGGDIISAAAVGASAGLSIGSKFSAIPFLFVITIAVVVVHAISRKNFVKGLWHQLHPLSAVAAVSCFLLALWASFGFGFEALATPEDRPYEAIESLPMIPHAAKEALSFVAELPAPLFVNGLRDGLGEVLRHAADRHETYLLGEFGERGWWYYYLVGLAVKTPIPLIILVLAGVGIGVQGLIARTGGELVTPVAAVAAVLFFTAFSPLNLGIRHILVVYPLLCVVAAAWLMRAFSSRKTAFAGAALVLLVAQVGAVAFAYPDFLAYFNRLAGSEPSRVLIQGDLDWGQDLDRLAREQSRLGIQEIHAAINGSARVGEHLEGYTFLAPGQKAKGWVAVSLWEKVSMGDGYAWLDEFDPVVRVGKSIDLYHIE